MLAIARTVASNRTTTISTGITVHASSTCVLPYICAGSPGPELAFSRNFTTAHKMRLNTVRKITTRHRQYQGRKPRDHVGGGRRRSEDVCGAEWLASRIRPRCRRCAEDQAPFLRSSSSLPRSVVVAHVRPFNRRPESRPKTRSGVRSGRSRSRSNWGWRRRDVPRRVRG